MSEEGTTAEAGKKAKRVPAEVVKVTMADGREVEFSGKKRLDKETLIDGEKVGLRLDFRNGETRTFWLPGSLLLQSAAHGLSQKVGDETAGDEKVEDMVVHVDEILDRLSKEEWNKTRGEGESFSGASVVIRAVAEASNKSLAEVKELLKTMMEKQGLSRADLYKGFRKPGTKTAAIIKRLEEEALTADAKADGDELLAQLMG